METGVHVDREQEQLGHKKVVCARFQHERLEEVLVRASLVIVDEKGSHGGTVVVLICGYTVCLLCLQASQCVAKQMNAHSG